MNLYQLTEITPPGDEGEREWRESGYVVARDEEHALRVAGLERGGESHWSPRTLVEDLGPLPKGAGHVGARRPWFFSDPIPEEQS